ncbi:hypothetical protein J1G42_15185 [Cellulomonas sp. zg-ZUI222]|uniref:hypothetical protein n=1 Tax=Cellulomonas TaxID=1707 RepID=UPI001A93B012|nr:MULTISPECIES: hypothetical protein [Cellulomonas]MBO0901928.1 hypothetical protein [Cellulomonas sp. zg-ZUI22]MBO0922167.1 hypothetical protein [Cellulomonas wangleii]
MAANFTCIGLDATAPGDLDRILEAAGAGATPLGERDGITVMRWQDDGGARLVLEVDRQRRVLAVTPSFAAEAGAEVASLGHLNQQVWSADVLQDGEKVTALAADVEQSALLDPSAPRGGRAAVVAFGSQVQVLPDVQAFGSSPASLLSPDKEDHGEPPAHYVEQGWPWPPRMGPESFVSYGVFGDPAGAEAYARLNGTVLRSRTCRTALTGGTFHVARVRTVGFEADVCLAASEHPQAPAPGAVLAGVVYLVMSLEDAPAPEARAARRRWSLRR